MKMMKSSGWSSNTMGSDESWYDTSAAGAKIHAIPLSTPAADRSYTLTLHATIMVRGRKE
jgi:hypothetical protein